MDHKEHDEDSIQVHCEAITELKEKAQVNIPEEVARIQALRLALIDYGLPVALAAKIDKEAAYKLTAALHVKERD